jgi:dihydropyrimidine dehydrogenase (NAD+) subunit PreA
MNLSTNFLSIPFENPFVLASGPPAANYDMIARAFDAGWSGAVTKTLIIEPVKNLENRFASIKYGGEIIAFKNIELLSELPPDKWCAIIRKLKDNFPEKVVIASIMGNAIDDTQWKNLALGCQQAGADMIELNFSCPHGYPEHGKGSAIGQSAECSGKIVRWLKTDPSLFVPVVPKLTAAVADISYIGEAAASAGADGFCAINTYPSLMGFDLNTLLPKASVNGYTAFGGYSGAGLKPIALRAVSNLVTNPGIPVMACGGVSSGHDAAEFILLGAPVVQVCTAVMLDGFDIVKSMKNQLAEFMTWHNFGRIEDFCGAGNKRILNFSDLDPNYHVKAMIDQDKCGQCENCIVSCNDGGYQAIEMKNDFPTVVDEKCTGCSLCVQVCPNEAVSMVLAGENGLFQSIRNGER